MLRKLARPTSQVGEQAAEAALQTIAICLRFSAGEQLVVTGNQRIDDTCGSPLYSTVRRFMRRRNFVDGAVKIVSKLVLQGLATDLQFVALRARSLADWRLWGGRFCAPAQDCAYDARLGPGTWKVRAMSKRMIWILYVLAGCGVSEDAVREEIRVAGHCSVAADCVDIGSFCPYGCSIVVHRDEADRMRRYLQANNKNTCLYDCAQLKSITCDSGQCKANF